MKILYLDGSMGAAGDMLTSALIELFDDKTEMVDRLNRMAIPEVTYQLEECATHGICGSRMHVLVGDREEGDEAVDIENASAPHPHHPPRSFSEVRQIIDGLAVSDSVRADIVSVYQKIAEAESAVHGVEVTEVHFHEVGMMDAIADVAAVCYLIEELRPVHIYASPIHVGSGTVRSAHGILPVPAPATAYLLKGIPTYSDGTVVGELTTPTAAALLSYFVEEFCPQPMLRVNQIGYGCGKKDFGRPNALRALLGDVDERPETDLYELSCNLDDMTAEEIAFATERLFASGALDVYTTSILMKKGRPGVKLSVLCHQKEKEELVEKLFLHTTTLGVREQKFVRYEMDRVMRQVDTGYGTIQKKVATGYGATKEKLEYEDLARIAREKNIALSEVKEEVRRKE